MNSITTLKVVGKNELSHFRKQYLACVLYWLKTKVIINKSCNVFNKCFSQGVG